MAELDLVPGEPADEDSPKRFPYHRWVGGPLPSLLDVSLLSAAIQLNFNSL